LRCAYKFRSSGRLAYWAAKRGDRIGVAEGFVAEYAAAAFPSPCLALQREDQVRGGARQGASPRLHGWVCQGHWYL